MKLPALLMSAGLLTGCGTMTDFCEVHTTTCIVGGAALTVVIVTAMKHNSPQVSRYTCVNNDCTRSL